MAPTHDEFYDLSQCATCLRFVTARFVGTRQVGTTKSGEPIRRCIYAPPASWAVTEMGEHVCPECADAAERLTERRRQIREREQRRVAMIRGER